MKETTLMKDTTVQYYVGDLCYVMHDAWDEVCGLVPFDNSEHEFELEDGRKFILFSTAYGDGTYFDREGKSYSVDSGTIGAIKVDDIRDPEFNRIVGHGLGQFHEFPAEIDGLDCVYESGWITIFDVVINTIGAGEDSDDDYFEDEDA